MRQEGTGFMDGVPGVTQCPIPPGATFTYRYKVTSFGTYWYHSHYGNTLADGLFGPLIVHSPDDPSKRWRDFDFEEVLFIGDWYDDQSATILHGLRNASDGYRGLVFPTMPDAVLINGVGQTDCAKAQAGVQCSETQPYEIAGRIGSRLKLRLINPGSEAQIRFSVDQHVLKIVEVDDTPVQPLYVHELPVAPGQRYSVILHLNQGGARDAFWVRARTAAACLFGGQPLETLAVLRYTDWRGRAWDAELPDTQPWPDRAAPDLPCGDIDNLYTVVPLESEPLGPVAAQERLDTSGGRFVDPQTGAAFVGFGMDAGKGLTTYTNYIQDPALRQIEDGRALNGSHVASLSFAGDGGSCAGILINQLDKGLAHPFHLHGRPFHIVARGNGNMTLEGLAGVKLNLDNPLRRDTIVVPSASWALLRLPLDDPGVWAIHCHLGWHLGLGKLGIVVVRPDAVKGFEKPQDWLALCTGPPDEIGPSKRSPSQQEPIADAANEADVEQREDRALEERQLSVNTASLVLVEGGATVTAATISLPPAPSEAVEKVPTNDPAYNDIPSDPEAAWNAPGVVGNVTVGTGKNPLDSARQGSVLGGNGTAGSGNGTAVSGNETAVNGSASSGDSPANASGGAANNGQPGPNSDAAPTSNDQNATDAADKSEPASQSQIQP